MVSFLKVSQRLAWLLIAVAGIFLILAALNVTSVSPVVMAGLALTWVIWGGLLLWVARRIKSYMLERGEDFDFEMKPPQLKLRRKRKEADSESGP